jgi:hypothetical protein
MTSLANDCGIDQKTVASWLGILQSSYIIYLLKPFHNNFNKRILKTPKLYFYDTGVACSLSGIRNEEQIAVHAAKGALFENMIVSELLKNKFNAGETDNLFFWRDKTGNEVDVIMEEAEKLSAIEIKAGQTITNDYFTGLNYFSELSKSEMVKMVVYGGNQFQQRSNGIHIKPWKDLI